MCNIDLFFLVHKYTNFIYSKELLNLFVLYNVCIVFYKGSLDYKDTHYNIQMLATSELLCIGKGKLYYK